MKRFVCIVVAVFLALAVSTSAFAQEKKVYRWKMATTWSKGIPWHKTAEYYAKTVRCS